MKADEVITVNLARTRAEHELGLDAGFFKNDGEWKVRSKDFVSAVVEEPESPEKPKKSAPKPKPKPAAKVSTKRKSEEAQPVKKRQKKADAVISSETLEADTEEESKAPARVTKKTGAPAKKVKSTPVEVDVDDESQDDTQGKSTLSNPPEDAVESATHQTNGKGAEDSESEMSVLIDDPPPNKRQKKSTSPSTAKATTTTTKKAAKPAKELTPDEEEIKRLQGWLVKCGIRKVWGVELKAFETPKAKIKHLKGMLEGAGMTGRYSAEKAGQIREARELAVEIEAAKEFNDQWGQGSGDDDDDNEDGEKVEEVAKLQKRRPKGLIDFGDSGDED